ncbi:15311_t:CDS:1 [Funneliformis geosporum]|uniref:11458_t:CDS:1 n=1 Tax=Funneliformis geosporum TaxID=1117311 RepID=A0A9W4WR26_9GLOM|nr:15311_t:CDS:1 [Funneliformis geosporum]CAI2179995.1 11458_t:CDS:1 [Funneliformis geosporum]
MSNEHWEEISEWDIEEDVDLAQRITVHAVHSISEGGDDEEYQLIQAHKHPTYAAAAKWGRKSSNNEEPSKNNNKPNISQEKKKPSNPPKVDNTDVADSILKGDHDVDYDDTIGSAEISNRNETRRNNTKLHRIHSQKLLSSLISNAELESNQDLIKGDTNRDPEFKKYKLLKKTMALNKKSKSDRKGIEKLRVEVW